MGVLPCQFKGSDSVQSLGITGEETFDLIGVEGGNVKPMQDVTLVIHRKDGSSQKVTVTLRVDSPIEVEYLKHGGILPFVLRELMAAA
jgi:aconitate hydratase